MNIGEKNIIFGIIALIIAGFFGFYCGFTIEEHLSGRIYAMSYERLLLRGGHTHGMLIALYNIVLGPLLKGNTEAVKLKKIASWLGVLGFLLPVGLVLRGVTAASMKFAPVAGTGALCFIASLCALLAIRVSGKNSISQA